MTPNKENNTELENLIDIYNETIRLVEPQLAQVAFYNIKRTDTEEYPSYMYEKDVNNFYKGEKVWILFEDREPLFIDIYELCEILEIKIKISHFTDVYSWLLKSKIYDSESFIRNLVKFCGITGYFDKLPEYLSEDQFKYYQLTEYSNWYSKVQESMDDFHGQYLCKPEIIAANEETFRKIGYQGGRPGSKKIKYFGDAINSIETEDIYPELAFVIYDMIKDNQFVLVLEKDEVDEKINKPSSEFILSK
jgi:hypothetical protein